MNMVFDIKKFFSTEYRFEHVYEKFIIKYNILGIKFSRSIFHPLLNRKISTYLDKINKGGKTLLIVQFCGIGDYLLMRPFFSAIRNSKKYKDYKFILAGKTEFIELAQKYDTECFDDYVGFCPTSKKSRKDFFKFIKNAHVSLLININEGKTGNINDEISKIIKADEKISHIGFEGHKDLKVNPKRAKEILNQYTSIIDTGEEIMFIRDRLQVFFEKLINEKITKIQTLREEENKYNYDFIAISPYAGDKRRVYGNENYAKIIDFITENTKYYAVLIGGLADYKDSLNLLNLCKNKDKIINMVGKLSITTSIEYLKHAKLLIANETGTVHIAQNFGIKTICISNGSFMGIFQPYPKEESCVNYIYPDNIQDYLSSHNEYGSICSYDIKNINVEKVISYLKQMI